MTSFSGALKAPLFGTLKLQIPHMHIEKVILLWSLCIAVVTFLDTQWSIFIKTPLRPGWVEIKTFMFNYKATIQVNTDTYWLKPGCTDDCNSKTERTKGLNIQATNEQTKLNEHWMLKEHGWQPNITKSSTDSNRVKNCPKENDTN